MGSFYKYPSPPCVRDLFSFNVTFLCFLLFWRYLNKQRTVTSCRVCVGFYQRTVPYASDVCMNIMVVLTAAFHQDYCWVLARVRGAAKTNCRADRTSLIFVQACEI